MAADTIGPFLPPSVEAEQILESRRRDADRRDLQRETKSARIEIRAKPSLKTRAEAVAAREGKSLSDYTHDTLEGAVRRAERQAAKRQD